MNIEIIAIGDEILRGNIVNTNAFFLSKELKKQGFAVTKHTVLPDDEVSLKNGITEALSRNELIIATGGLGPTFDDKTKKVVSDIFGYQLEYDEILAQELFDKFEKNKYKKEQALVPKGAIVLKNRLGTAPGFIFEKDKHIIILLPGVPYEMEDMFYSYIVDFLKMKLKLKKKVFQENVNICLKKEDDIEPVLESLRDLNRDIDIGIYPYLSFIKVSFTVQEEDELKAKGLIAPLRKKLESAFKEYIFPSDKESLEEAVRDIFIEKKKTLALAESCTGGAIASAITSLPNSSCYFLGSIVSYANELKKNILHVNEITLSKYGAVSTECVQEMIKGIFDLTNSDYALAVSGIAGPKGGSEEKPVGTVYFAIAERGKNIDRGVLHIPIPFNKELKSNYLQGNADLVRSFIIKYCVSFALSLLWVRINHNLTYFTK